MTRKIALIGMVAAMALGGAGCDEESTGGSDDAGAGGTDAGAVADGGASDGGPETDAGITMDAGDAADAGDGADSGTDPDAGTGSDAGDGADAGDVVDAGDGVDAGSDGGAGVDAGMDASVDAGADAGFDSGITFFPDAAACGNIGTNCRTSGGGDTCGAGLMCWTSGGRPQGVCAPSDMCGIAACSTSGERCLNVMASTQGTCVTSAELPCICSSPRGRLIFDCPAIISP